jgi:flavin reductase (DIM6/NTAB) family NADH-FMN oxidoreductase RutF
MDQAFTERAFRDALGSFPTGITVVTAMTASGERLGLTVSSFNSVSLSPPLILFSIGRRASSFRAWQCADAYAVNILTAAQEDLAMRFGQSSPNKWSGVSFKVGASGAPLLCDALAWFECLPYSRHNGGDHEIFIARVVGLRSVHNVPPLAFFRGRFCQLSGESIAVSRSAEGLFFQGW